jgi:hypothetical protein
MYFLKRDIGKAYFQFCDVTIIHKPIYPNLIACQIWKLKNYNPYIFSLLIGIYHKNMMIWIFFKFKYWGIWVFFPWKIIFINQKSYFFQLKFDKSPSQKKKLDI